eukprot:TRINITY_DN65646_c0_g1_i1.p3 TRINITY_DN65646_c0_g1~~TRINITY_DN65646_c0_g1_i1.p3  ORF type:complete len:138 (-),score=17.66 TRINITY_DN65646_c0_g1_i1:179-592(-)
MEQDETKFVVFAKKKEKVKERLKEQRNSVPAFVQFQTQERIQTRRNNSEPNIGQLCGQKKLFSEEQWIDPELLHPLDIVGKGAFATVHRCKLSTEDKEVAVKILKPEVQKSKSEVEQFSREANTLSQLRHKQLDVRS